mgnify:FL=1
MLDPYVERDGNILLPLARHTEVCEYGMTYAVDYASRNPQQQLAHPPRVDDLVHRSSNGGSPA